MYTMYRCTGCAALTLQDDKHRKFNCSVCHKDLHKLSKNQLKAIVRLLEGPTTLHGQVETIVPTRGD